MYIYIYMGVYAHKCMSKFASSEYTYMYHYYTYYFTGGKTRGTRGGEYFTLLIFHPKEKHHDPWRRWRNQRKDDTSGGRQTQTHPGADPIRPQVRVPVSHLPQLPLIWGRKQGPKLAQTSQA